MFHEETVFVLGAGSNLDYKFVTGDKLKANIKDCLAGGHTDQGFYRGSDFLKKLMNASRFGLSREEVIETARRIRTGLDGKDSIDDYLHAHGTDGTLKAVGKFAIVHCILELERNSKLVIDPNDLQRVGIELPWGTYDHLWRVLTKGVTASGLAEVVDEKFNPVTIVTFNYDRSLEQFLFCKFVATYGLDVRAAKALVREFKIFHAYGSVGPWIYPHCSLGDDGFPFGGKVQTNRGIPLFTGYKMSAADDDSVPILKRLADNISTYMEDADDKTVAHIKSVMHSARQIYFLGMGYHEQNMRLLMPSNGLTAHTIAGTAVKIGGHRCGEIQRHLLSKTTESIRNGDDVIKSERTCGDLFADYGTTMENYAF